MIALVLLLFLGAIALSYIKNQIGAKSSSKNNKQSQEYTYRESNPNQEWDWWESPTQEKTVNHDEISYKNCYQAKSLLTKHEWFEYKKLKELAKSKDLIICPKVRLLDIIVPREDKKTRQALLWKVQSKHVDFVLCDESMRIKAILELDDSSHDAPDRIERDHFVDEILTSVGYRVIRTRLITEDTLKGL